MFVDFDLGPIIVKIILDFCGLDFVELLVVSAVVSLVGVLPQMTASV